jgi:hypothetical protein
MSFDVDGGSPVFGEMGLMEFATDVHGTPRRRPSGTATRVWPSSSSTSRL